MERRVLDVNLLERLTIEVTKENPEIPKLKKYMEEAGLEYSEDPIERINLVLNEIKFFEVEESNDEK